MPICEKCGVEFDENEAECIFDDNDVASFSVDYYRLNRCLCGNCAIEEYERGNYSEECECCHKKFFPEDEKIKFESLVSNRVTDADMYEHGILCADCAAEKLREEIDDEYDAYDEHGGLSVHDAALIWLSHGKDEDYMLSLIHISEPTRH